MVIKVETQDLSKYEAMVDVLGKMLEHRRRKPTTKMDEAYYELLYRYYGQHLRAKEEGKFLVAHSSAFPTEIFYAMDLVPLSVEDMASILNVISGNFEELGSIAKSFGLAPEVCSVHRISAAVALQGWLPRPDAVVFSQSVCDSVAKTGHLLSKVYEVPFYFVDRPYWDGEGDVRFYAQELKEAVEFLEGLTGKRMDWDRLREALRLSYQVTQLQNEINDLTKAIPCPGSNRLGDQVVLVNSHDLGSEEGVRFCRVVRDELKERVEKGLGYYPIEKHRLICLYQAPAWGWKLLDWMGREQGAAIVSQPICYHWTPWELDLEHPLETLARRFLAMPANRQLYGPAQQFHVNDSVAEALNHHCQGAIYFAMINCRQGCGLIRLIKDALAEVGIPTCVVDMDAQDPSYVTMEAMKEKLEGFFETLEGL